MIEVHENENNFIKREGRRKVDIHTARLAFKFIWYRVKKIPKGHGNDTIRKSEPQNAAQMKRAQIICIVQTEPTHKENQFLELF